MRTLVMFAGTFWAELKEGRYQLSHTSLKRNSGTQTQTHRQIFHHRRTERVVKWGSAHAITEAEKGKYKFTNGEDNAEL